MFVKILKFALPWIFAVMLITLSFGSTVAASNTETIIIKGDYLYNTAYEVLTLVNAERAKVGAAPLTMDKDLLSAGMLRAAENSIDFDHKRPNGEICFTISPKLAGENLTVGNSTAVGAMKGWMESDGHRANILNPEYKILGVGCFKIGSMYYWVQLFGRDTPASITRPANKNVEQPIEILKSAFTVRLALNMPDAQTITQPLRVDRKIQMVAYIHNPNWFWGKTPILAKSFTWNSSNKSVATVSSTGELKTVGYGTTTITAKAAGGTVYSLQITVSEFRGDIDENGAINLADIVMMRNWIMKGSLTSKQIGLADLDSNGVINLSDIVALRNIIMGV